MYCFIGMTWWGVGAREMALATPNSHSVSLWNLKDRLDRAVIRTPLQFPIAKRRMATAIRGHRYDATFVVNPHRLSPAMMSVVRRSSSRTIALLGDDPIGERTVNPIVANGFDLFALADMAWSSSLHTDRPIVEAAWRSTVVADALVGGCMQHPSGYAFVGTAYPERVALATALAQTAPVMTVGNWPSISRVQAAGARSREATLALLRERRSAVVNVLHPQFKTGLNPQYYDYLACGVPQVVVHGSAADTWVPSPTGKISVDLSADGALTKIFSLNNQLRDAQPIHSYLFTHTVERLLAS